MSKTRFSTTDTKAMVRDIRATLLGQRVANIYDLNDKTYLFKFAVPGKSEKILLLLESGVRFHTTKYARDKSNLPSPFAMKLRKHIRTRRLEDVKQLCNDRVVDFKFGSGDTGFHIILELYANGNIILTDGNYEILALLRSHQFEEDVAIKVNEIYPMAFATSMDTALLNRMPMLGSNDVAAINGKTPNVNDDSNVGETGVAAGIVDSVNVLTIDSAAFIAWAEQKERDSGVWAISASKSTGAGKKNKVKKMTMRQLLLSRDSGVSSYGPEILDHCLLKAGVKASMKVADFILDAQRVLLASAVLAEIKSSESLLQSLDVPGQHGFVLYSKSVSSLPIPILPVETLDPSAGTNTEASTVPTGPVEILHFLDFVPRMFMQHDGQNFLEFPSFDEAVDEYYCKVEEQKLERVAVTAEENAKKKVDKVKGDQSSLIATLEKQQRKMEEGALLVELYAEDVDKCMLVINSALTSGMSWDDIEAMVAAETAKGNSIASLVSRLRLERNFIVLKLTNLYADESDEEEDCTTPPTFSSSSSSSSSHRAQSSSEVVEVEVDLSMSAYANVSRMYGHKKVAQAKEIKTLEASQRALVAVENQSAKTLEAQKIKRNLQAVRKVHWFEKFNWFVTSEGYLVLSGRDAQQNEALVKRYLRPGDVYVHAELHGASSCIVRCKAVVTSASSTSSRPQSASFKPISPFALQEAGNMTVCRSGAWGAKIVTSAWWVFGSQVSKTAPTGEFLPTGSFMIYGKKNFLPPMPLEMGFGVMFRLDDGSVTRHAGERKDKSSSSDETESVLSEAASRYGIEFDGLGLREVDTDDEEEQDGDGDGDDSGEEEDDGDEGKTEVPAVSIAAFQLSSIPEAGSDNESNAAAEDDGDHDKDDGVVSTASLESEDACASAEEISKGCAGRLTAKERRLLKKAKKGSAIDVPVPVPVNVSTLRGTQSTATKGTGSEEDPDLSEVDVDVDEKDDGDEEERGTDSDEDTHKPSNTKNPATKGAANSSSSSTGSNNNNKNDGKSKGSADNKNSSDCNSKNTNSTSNSSKGMKGFKSQSQSVSPKTPLAGLPPSATNKKKFVNKKKAKRYADQDDDERELAMLALGHVHVGEKYGEKEEALKKEKEQKDRVIRQDRAGIKIVKDGWQNLMSLLLPAVRQAVEGMIALGSMKEGEIDGHEIKTLASFNEQDALSVIGLFKDGDNLARVGNKSGFLAGIMRRYSKDSKAASSSTAPRGKAQKEMQDSSDCSNLVCKDLTVAARGHSDDANHDDDVIEMDMETEKDLEEETGGVAGVGESVMSRRERKKKDQQEIQSILEEEGVLDEEEGRQADEIDKLTGKPLPEDVLLYAVPVCGPYSAIRSFKYSVKLTPGTMKKGKAAKQAIDVFTRGKECSVVEKALMRSLNDPEMVAIMIGDIKLSMPGLYQVQRAKKGRK